MNPEWRQELGSECRPGKHDEDRLPLVPSAKVLRELVKGHELARVLYATGIRRQEASQLGWRQGRLCLHGGRDLACDDRTARFIRRGFQAEGFDEWLSATDLAQQFAWSGRTLTSQVFRHGFAVGCLEGGMDLRVLSQLLGHALLRNTLTYVNITDERIEREWRRCHPYNLSH